MNDVIREAFINFYWTSNNLKEAVQQTVEYFDGKYTYAEIEKVGDIISKQWGEN